MRPSGLVLSAAWGVRKARCRPEGSVQSEGSAVWLKGDGRATARKALFSLTSAPELPTMHPTMSRDLRLAAATRGKGRTRSARLLSRVGADTRLLLWAVLVGIVLGGGACGRSEFFCLGDSCARTVPCVGPECEPGSHLTSCASDEECPSQYACIEGGCRLVTGDCSWGRPCPYGSTCVGAKCVATVCATSGECAEGSICDNGFCLPVKCDGTMPCLPSENCINGRCVPGTKVCSSGSQCPPGTWCIEGECRQYGASCVASRECPEGQVCVTGKCTPTGEECGPTVPCAPGARCVDGRCVPDVPGCGDAGPCLPGFECQEGRCCAAGVCAAPPTLCGFDVALCPAETECRDSMCCVAGGAVCFPPLIPCTKSIECPVGWRCVLGVCVGGN